MTSYHDVLNFLSLRFVTILLRGYLTQIIFEEHISKLIIMPRVVRVVVETSFSRLQQNVSVLHCSCRLSPSCIGMSTSLDQDESRKKFSGSRKKFLDEKFLDPNFKFIFLCDKK